MWRDVDGIRVAVDAKVRVWVGKVLAAEVVASPVDLEDLALGLLYSDGLVEGTSEIAEISVEGTDVYVRLSSPREVTERRSYLESCGVVEGAHRVGPVEVDLAHIRDLLAEFGRYTMPLTSPTLAMHTSGLHVDGEWLIVHDTSRHSSVLKLVGRALRLGVDASRGVAFTTGRASSDMVVRLARLGVPVVVSLRGPLYSGYDAARRTGVVLVANVRGRGLVAFFPARP